MKNAFAVCLLIALAGSSLLQGQMNWVCATESASFGERYGHVSVAFDGKMWIVGSHDVWCSTDGVNWSCTVDSAPWPLRAEHSVLVFDNKMWLIGGYRVCPETVVVYTDVWCSTNGADWVLVTDSASWGEGQMGHTSAVFDNKMWLIGGGFTTDVWCSADGADWVLVTDSASWVPRIHHVSAVFDNKMWLIGGADGEGLPLNDVWCSTDGIVWTCAVDSAQWEKRWSAPSVVFDNKMWLMCGQGWNDSGWVGYTDVWCSTDGIVWTCAVDSTPWAERYGFSAVVFNGRVWIIGGRHHSQNMKDVWRTTDAFISEEQIPITLSSVAQSTLYSVSEISELVISQPSVLFDMTGRQINVNQIRLGIYFLGNRKIVVLR